MIPFIAGASRIAYRKCGGSMPIMQPGRTAAGGRTGRMPGDKSSSTRRPSQVRTGTASRATIYVGPRSSRCGTHPYNRRSSGWQRRKRIPAPIRPIHVGTGATTPKTSSAGIAACRQSVANPPRRPPRGPSPRQARFRTRKAIEATRSPRVAIRPDIPRGPVPAKPHGSRAPLRLRAMKRNGKPGDRKGLRALPRHAPARAGRAARAPTARCSRRASSGRRVSRLPY